ncbi:uncharacterized protein si:ch211-106e7.2 [Dicentrarchus labrax]|uniref:uncharacterized protein si:ch211-106e7.2 n=1 Tax=Dicentrarchus labrax TaxID=13489 RepID=UPI0021F570A3|nr:uncharacterized protein si:ch211-106e7.2 [Dicentrarchus labrax]XP_051238329.1 uncharacterized protein si:ch211-106e7.2 [Dicentrarchus labrax]
MTKMHPCAWINGQYRQLGPSSRSPQTNAQHTHVEQDTMWNPQAAAANNSYQYTGSNTGVRPPHFNRQTSNWQTSAVPYQAVSCQQPAGGESRFYYMNVSAGNQQNSYTNTQSRNLHLDTNGHKVASQRNFHPNHGFLKSSTQSSPNVTIANTTYPQQDLSAHWNQQGIVNAQRGRQTAHNQNLRQNGNQQGFIPSLPPPSYNETALQSCRNNSITTNSSATEQLSHLLSVRTQKYPVHINSMQNKGDKTTINPAGHTQEQMFKYQMIARIEEDLHKSFPASSGGQPPAYTTSTYRGKQLASEVRMTESNQHMQPVTRTVTESYNSNASQSSALNFALTFSKTTHMSRTQQSVAAPQQISVPNVFYVKATGNGNGEKESQSMMPESNSSQRSTTESSVANNHDILEAILSVKANDASNHSSPGCMGTRAVAVVQPLSQEYYQVASKHTPVSWINQSKEHAATDGSLRSLEKYVNSPAVATITAPYLRHGSPLHPENPNQTRSNKYIISHSAGSNDSSFASSPDSAGHQHRSQKNVCAEDTGSEPAINMEVEQHVKLSANQSVTPEVQVSQSKNSTEPEACVPELSQVPTLPWTHVTLTKLIEQDEQAQSKLKPSSTMFDSLRLLNMFWDGNTENLITKLKTGWYRGLITDVKEFCHKHTTQDSVILSQVKPSSLKQLQSYHVLKDNEVYSEPPYKSSWLNVSEQLDDIDNEFGFPWTWKHHLHVLESHSQPDVDGAVNSFLAQAANEVPNKDLSQTELEPVDSAEEKQASAVEATSTQAASPNETEIADSSDSYYSFEIKVLPPEEAMVIFEQAQRKMPQSMDTDPQPEIVMNSSVQDELPEAMDVTLNDSKLNSVLPIQQVCCLSKWLHIICASEESSSKCECNNEQRVEDCTDKTLGGEEMAVHRTQEENLCAIRSPSKFHMEGENQVEDGENINNQIMTYSQSELSENDQSDKEPKNISKVSINSTLSCILRLSDTEDEDLISSDTEIQSVSGGKEIETLCSTESKVASQISGLAETCGQIQLTSSDVAESSSETEISVTAALQTTLSHNGKCETVERKQKRLDSHDRFHPFFKKSNKTKSMDSQPSRCGKVVVDATDSEPLASNVTSVQLVLFGSASRNKCVSIGSRKRYVSPPGAVSYGVARPSEILNVYLSPLKKQSCQTVRREEHSVKPYIYEKWRHFVPNKSRHRSKLKKQKCNIASLSEGSLKKDETGGPATCRKQPVPSQMSTWSRKTKRCLSLKKRRSLSNELKCREKTKKDAITQPADEKSNNGNGSYRVMSKGNNILKFSVLPKTFIFKDGSNEGKQTNDPVSDKPGLDERKDKTPNTTVTTDRGTWYPDPEKRSCPLSLRPDRKTSSVFEEFQKKYKKRTQTPH